MGQEVFKAIKQVEMNARLSKGGDVLKEILLDLDVIRNAAWKDQEESQDHVITLCGSTRFYNDFKLANLNLTLNDWVVLSIGIDTKSDADIKAAGSFKIDHARLDRLHKKKIDKSQAIMVIDINGYVGESTRSEIEYAQEHHKDIYSYSKTTDFANPAKFEFEEEENVA